MLSCRPVENLSWSTGAGLNEMAEEAASVWWAGIAALLVSSLKDEKK